VYIDREKKNLDELNTEYDKLKTRLNNVDGTLNKSNDRLRKEIEKMKEQMEKITLYSIDIARDPSTAIKLICDPILDLLNIKVEDFEE
jgi:chromosome segregation ATPase